MKYLVMESRESYAVLMDEEARFVTAANLNYSVGETVTDPVLIPSRGASSRRKGIIITKFAAAAACLALICGGSYAYYARNYKVYSTVLISSDANIKMSVNKKGKVVKLEACNEAGEKLLEGYDGKGKDKVDVANELLEKGAASGIISSGASVDVYIDAKDSDDYEEYRSEFENELKTPNVNVLDLDEYKEIPAPPERPSALEPDVPKPGISAPKPEDTPASPPEPPKPPTEDAEKPQPPKPDENAPKAPSEAKPGDIQPPSPEGGVFPPDKPGSDRPDPPAPDEPEQKPEPPLPKKAPPSIGAPEPVLPAENALSAGGPLQEDAPEEKPADVPEPPAPEPLAEPSQEPAAELLSGDENDKPIPRIF